MYKLIENKNEIIVNFDARDILRDAPRRAFAISKRRSKTATKKLAVGYAEGIIDLYEQTKNMSAARQVIPGMADDKVNIKIDVSTNKTGCVGVYLERSYDRLGRKTPYSYTANYTMDGKQRLKRFPLNNFSTDEEAYRAAVAFRLLSINLTKDMLQ